MSTKTNPVIPYKKMVMLKIFPEKQSPYEECKFYRFCLLCACLATLLFSVVYLQKLLAPPSATDVEVHAHSISVAQGKTCSDSCRIVLVESIPEGLEFNSSINPSIYQSWLNLIGEAQSSIDIASFYWTLTNKDTGTHEPTAYQGEQILKKLIHLAGKESDVSVRIAVNVPEKSQPIEDLNMLMQAGADVRQVNMRNLTTGVLHTKFWVIDKKHIYLGSANMDWRSLTQVKLSTDRVHPLVRLNCKDAKLLAFEEYKQGVKELGVVVYNCSCLAEDLGKIFEAYWYLGQAGKSIPSHWPDSYSTSYNKTSPLVLPLNGTSSTAYLSSSPPSLCADGRTQDLDAILTVIDDAEEFVYIAVMNYLPTMEYSRSKRYWSEIDTQLRRVAYERAVHVRLLISCWGNSPPVMFPFLLSLAAVRYQKSKLDIQVKLFVVPSSPSQKEIPYARVNHNKYMVTDKVAYIGTSNWSGDYFLNTAGSALVVNQTAAQSPETTLQRQLQAVFLRDWDSVYSTPLYQHIDTRKLCYR